MLDELRVEVVGGLERPGVGAGLAEQLATWCTTPRPMRSIIPHGPIPLCNVIIQARSMLWASSTTRRPSSIASKLAIELPLKMQIWPRADGPVHVSYQAPDDLAHQTSSPADHR